ncbi:MAG: M16 family metallopeptidase [Syntrophobacteria bacterium]
MGRRIFAWLLVLMMLFTTATLAWTLTPEIQNPEILGLSREMVEQADRMLPAKPGDTFMQLKNGMTVLVRENHASRVVSCQVLVKTGSIREGVYFSGGISHYLEHVVAGGSTSSFTEEQAKEMLKSLGGASNAYTGYDQTVYYINTTAAHYRKALELLLSYVSECVFDPKEVRREKAVIQQEFKLMQTDPDRQQWRLFLQTAYLRHPIRHPVIGYEDVFVNITRKDLLTYYRERYTPQNMVVTVVGDVDTAEALASVLELGRGMKRTFEPPGSIEREPAQNAPRWAEKRFAPARLTTMVMGFHTVSLTHPDLYPLDVLAIILGEGRSSRLYLELKDRRDLVLSADAFSWTPSYARGVFGFSLSLDHDKVEPTLEVLWREIERVQKDLVEASELEKAKRRVIADSVLSKQTAAQMASSLASSFAATGDPYFDSRYVERIKAVSREDIRRVARRYLKRERNTVTVLSPEQESTHGVNSLVPAEEGTITKLTLENGLTLLLKRNAAVPLVHCKLFGLGGQRFEPEDMPGLGLYTMQLLTKGTRTRSKRQIAETIEGLGGSLNSGSGRNTYYVSLTVLKQDCAEGLELLADVLQNPKFPDKEINKQREDTLLAIRRLDEDWQREVERVFRRHYYEEHPYANDLLGTQEAVQKFTRADVQRFYRRTVRPNNAVLAIFGDIDPEEVVSRVRSFFGTWRPERLDTPELQETITPLSSDARIRKKTEKVSAAIFMGTNGLTLKDPDRPTLDVIDALLSGIGYPSGWLHEALRGGQRSLVYVIHAFPSYGMDGGHFAIVTQTTMANYEKVVSIILENLERLQRRPVKAEELEEAKEMCIIAHEMNLESNGAQATSAALNELFGLGYSWDSHYPELIRQVRDGDVLRVARELFRHHMIVSAIPEHPVEVTIPPEQKERLHEK